MLSLLERGAHHDGLYPDTADSKPDPAALFAAAYAEKLGTEQDRSHRSGSIQWADVGNDTEGAAPHPVPDEELFESHPLVLPQPEDEEADKALMRQLLFKGKMWSWCPEKKTKTPDFKVMKNGELKGYCELKSLRDDWIFAVPKDLKPGEIREEHEEDPTAHALARVIGKAAAQFDAVNPDHAQPNILVIMSHARLRGPADLHLAIGGLAVPNGDRLFLLVDPNEKIFQKAWEKQQKLWEDARKIDLFYWIYAHTKTVRHVINKDGLRHLEARDLMNVAA